MTDVATAASHAPTSVSVPDEPPSSFDHFYEIVVAFRDAHPDANGNLSVAPFLEAMKKFLRIVDALGSPALGEMVKKDVSANITKVAEAAGTWKVLSVVDLLKAELGDSSYSALIKSETGRGRNSGSVAMLWMKRTLQFVVGLVNHLLTDPVISLSEASRKSYSATLKKCHPFITRNVFDAGLRFVPLRKVFYENIAGSDDAAKAEAGLAEFVAASTPLMNSLIFSYKQNKLETLVY